MIDHESSEISYTIIEMSFLVASSLKLTVSTCMTSRVTWKLGNSAHALEI